MYLGRPIFNPVLAEIILNMKLMNIIMSTTMLNSAPVAQISMAMDLLMRVLILVMVTPVVH